MNSLYNKPLNLLAVSSNYGRFDNLRNISKSIGFVDKFDFMHPDQIHNSDRSSLLDVLIIDGSVSLNKTHTHLERIGKENPGISFLMINMDAVFPVLKLQPSSVIPVAANCDGEALLGMALRAVNLQRILNSSVLIDCIGDVETLPSVPKSYQQLMAVMNDPEASISDVAAIVQSDPAMTIKILQLVNSVFFGRSKRTSSITQAVGFLGLELLKSLVLTAHIFDAVDANRLRHFSIDHFQNYSIAIARLAQQFLTEKKLADEAFTAAIVHDIGKLVIALQRPKEFEEIIHRVAATGESQAVIEQEILGITHAEAGAYLLSRWGIPWVVVEATAFHHRPWDVSTVAGGCEVLAAVHAADALHGILTCGDPEDRLNIPFLEKAGFASVLPRWRDTAQESVQ